MSFADDQIHKMYKRLMDALPECPVHGQCVPHAVKWITNARQQVGDAVESECNLTTLAREMLPDVCPRELAVATKKAMKILGVEAGPYKITGNLDPSDWAKEHIAVVMGCVLTERRDNDPLKRWNI